jgi:hypothetical protein
MRARRVDDNQAAVVKRLRQFGASVQVLSSVGKGVPDLLVGFRGKNFLLEVKDGRKPPSARKLTEDEGAWHASWFGAVAIVESEDEAMRAIGCVTT